MFILYFFSTDIKGKRLLDVGTGPTVHSIISACTQVEEIHLSDYAEKNRKYLHKWLEGRLQYNSDTIKFALDLESSR